LILDATSQGASVVASISIFGTFSYPNILMKNELTDS
jgi:hypothetical protein